jgi:hypothetical protein
VREFAYDQASIEEHGELFPEEIFADPWIAFHGTSGARANAIESNGLRWPAELISKKDVEFVVEIFRAIDWAGLSKGGLPVLEPFSLNHDFRGNESKPTYLAEYSVRAMTYASHDFAGGETCRALRYAFNDLQSYLDSVEVRRAHATGQGRRMSTSSRGSETVDMVWLRQKLSECAKSRRICESAFAKHTFGVVYAVQFDPIDLTQLGIRKSMGIEFRGVIAPCKLVAKVSIPNNAKSPLVIHEGVRDRYLKRLADSSTLLGRLRELQISA